MKTTFKKMTGMLGLLLAGALLTATAVAQCTGLPAQAGKYHKQSWSGENPAASLQLVADSTDPIVGMWTVKFISEGNDGIPDGTVLDNGLAQWHSDGTEYMNSGFRAPTTSAVCQGVWANLGGGIYKLNHFAWGWDPSNSTAPIGPGQIKENITLAKDQNAFSGKFIIDQYDLSGNRLGHVTGNLVGQRITIDTHAKQLL